MEASKTEPSLTGSWFALTAGLLSAVILSTLAGCCACRRSSIPDLQPAALSWVQGREGRLRVEDAGRGGLPVLFVHGLGGNRSAWSAQVEHLAARRRVVTFDLRGHGESAPAQDGDYSVQGFADDVESVADALHLKRFVLVGHSIGGAVIGAYAGRHPDRVAGLLFVDPVGDLTRLPAKDTKAWLSGLEPAHYDAFTEKWFSEMLAPARPPVRSLVLESLRKTSPSVIRGSVRGLLTYRPEEALACYRGPMLTVITPENDEPYSLQNLVPGLASREIRGTSHWVMMDEPRVFNGIMDGFLASLERGSADAPAPQG